MIKRLSEPLEEHLKDAQELYIAVALTKGYGLKLIAKTIPDLCYCEHLAGVYLATLPSVLRGLLERRKISPSNVEPKIYEAEVFHPKVHIIRKRSNKLVVFIGYANAICAGLNKDVELGVMVDDQPSCDDTLQWFNDLFGDGVLLISMKLPTKRIEF